MRAFLHFICVVTLIDHEPLRTTLHHTHLSYGVYDVSKQFNIHKKQLNKLKIIENKIVPITRNQYLAQGTYFKSCKKI